jgi:hypothetical protein
MDQLGLAIQRGKVAVACQACAFLVEASRLDKRSR